MGQKGSKSENEYQQLMDQYDFKQKFRDTRFGDVRLLEHKITREQFILKEVINSHQEDHKRNVQEYKYRMEFKSPYVLELKDFAEKIDSQFCSTFYKSYLLFEYSQETLDLQLSDRILSKQYYNEDDLWYMIDCLIQGLCHLQNHRIYHGDLKASNIFCSNTQAYKIADQGLFNSTSSYAMLLSDQNYPKKEIYLSPYLLKALQHNEFKPFHNIFKSDVYSLGMIILNAATLKNSDEIYDYGQFIIDRNILEQRLNQVTEQYGYDIISMIKSMLEEDEDLRPDFQRMMEQLENNPKVKLIRQSKGQSNNLFVSNTIEQVKQSSQFDKDLDYKFEQSGYINRDEQMKQHYQPINYEQTNTYEIKQSNYNNEINGDNYDDINALLSKYGIEPIGVNQNTNFNQPKTTNYEFKQDNYEFKTSNFDYKPSYEFKSTTYDFKPTNFDDFKPTNFDDYKPANYEFKPSNYDQNLDVMPNYQEAVKKSNLMESGNKITSEVDQILASMKQQQQQQQNDYNIKQQNFDYKPQMDIDYKFQEYKPVDYKIDQYNLNPTTEYKATTYEYKAQEYKPLNYEMKSGDPNLQQNIAYQYEEFKPSQNYEFKATTMNNDFKPEPYEFKFEDYKPQSYDFKYDQYRVQDISNTNLNQNNQANNMDNQKFQYEPQKLITTTYNTTYEVPYNGMNFENQESRRSGYGVKQQEKQFQQDNQNQNITDNINDRKFNEIYQQEEQKQELRNSGNKEINIDNNQGQDAFYGQVQEYIGMK